MSERTTILLVEDDLNIVDLIRSNLTARGFDVVVSIDAMGGDRGVADVVRGMGKSLEKNPRLRYILHGDAAQLGLALQPETPLAARTEIRHAATAIGMHEKPSRALRSGRRRTHSTCR